MYYHMIHSKLPGTFGGHFAEKILAVLFLPLTIYIFACTLEFASIFHKKMPGACYYFFWLKNNSKVSKMGQKQ